MVTSKKSRVFAAVAAVAVVLIACFGYIHLKQAQARKARLRAANELVAVVNDTLIHKSDLSVLSPPVPSKEALGLMVDFTLLDQEASKKHVTVSDAEMQQQRRQVVGDQPGKTYADVAKSLGRTPAGLDLQLRHAALLRKLAALEFKSPIGKMFHARGILVKPNGSHAGSAAQARALAVKLQNQVEGGADIASLARKYSDDPESAPAGGDFGIIQTAGAPNLVRFAPDFPLQKALANAVSTATPGSLLHGPIQGQLGYWVVEVVSTSAKPRTDTARYRQIQGLWQEMWISRLEPKVMGDLRGHAAIQPPIAT